MEQRTLSAAYKSLLQQNLEGSSAPEADASATHEALEAQIERYLHWAIQWIPF